jgi:predicted  nucleic acid-binding Zn-ribbon protein
MKLKNLKKKIRRLEARLREGPKKLAKLKRKLEALEAAKARKAQKKAAARAVARQTTSTQKEQRRSRANLQVKPVGAKGTAARKAKRKLNLSPERRAQLAAAMTARWAAKRAALEASPQTL